MNPWQTKAPRETSLRPGVNDMDLSIEMRASIYSATERTCLPIRSHVCLFLFLFSVFCILYLIFSLMHADVIKWKHFPRYWPFVRGIHRSPVNSPHKGQWRGALMFSLICVWINGWVNNHKAGDLIRYRAHYDVIVMSTGKQFVIIQTVWNAYIPTSLTRCGLMMPRGDIDLWVNIGAFSAYRTPTVPVLNWNILPIRPHTGTLPITQQHCRQLTVDEKCRSGVVRLCYYTMEIGPF